MTILLWIILIVMWLISVAYNVYLGIKDRIEDSLPYTVWNAIVDIFWGSLGAGILIGICHIFLYIAKVLSPFLNKRIL